MKVTLLDLQSEYVELRDEILPALDGVCRDPVFVQSEEGEALESWKYQRSTANHQTSVICKMGVWSRRECDLVTSVTRALLCSFDASL
jgi:hypothetical protein